MKSLVLVRLSKCVPSNHSEEMKNVEEKKKSTTHFSKFDNKRDGKKSGEEKTPSELFSFLRFLFLCAADRCHLKLQRYFLIVKGRAGGGWMDRRVGGWLGGWCNGLLA